MSDNKSTRRVIGVAVAIAVFAIGGYAADRQLGLLDRLLGSGAGSVDDHAGGEHEALHTCPMHPEVVQDGPGTCPICKMDLVPMAAGRGQAGQGGHADHTHGEADHSVAGDGPLNGFDLMPEPGTRAFCPVMKHEFTVKESSPTTEHEGKVYVFCCQGCVEPFEESPATYLKNLEAREAARKAAPALGADHPGVAAPSPAGSAVTIDPVVVQNMGVRVAEVEHGPIYRHVKTVGEVLVAEDQVSVVNLRFSGWVERIMVDETGQQVKRGQPLFAVYSPEVVAAQEEYLLAVRSSGPDSPLARSAARRLELWGVPKAVLGRVAKSGKSLHSITISAPRAGYVLHKNVVEGAHVQAGADLYHIGDLDLIWVNAEVYEHDAAWVQLGQQATMELSFQQGRTWEGAVSYIYPTLNPRSRSLTVRLEFENPGLSLRPGMLATVRIETRRQEHATTVPSEAVIHSGERRLVFVAQGGGRYEPREVVIGLIGDNRRSEVIEGLVEGELVVVSGQFLLDSESQLQEAVQKLLEARLESRRGAARDG